MAEIHTR